jgi:deoxycytidylate deaminase
MTQEYPYLPAGRSILYVPITNPFMAEAKRVCMKYSTYHNHPTGAVVVKDGMVIGRGANQSAIHNTWLLNLHKKYLCVRKWLHVKSGTLYWLCPGCASAKMHAEPRAVRDARKNCSDINDADLYLWGHWWCCKPCWDAMIGAGIKNVYLLDESIALFKK